MTNSIGTGICAACIAVLEYSQTPATVAIPLVLLFGFMIGRFATRKHAL